MPGAEEGVLLLSWRTHPQMPVRNDPNDPTRFNYKPCDFGAITCTSASCLCPARPLLHLFQRPKRAGVTVTIVWTYFGHQHSPKILAPNSPTPPLFHPTPPWLDLVVDPNRLSSHPNTTDVVAWRAEARRLCERKMAKGYCRRSSVCVIWRMPPGERRGARCRAQDYVGNAHEEEGGSSHGLVMLRLMSRLGLV